MITAFFLGFVALMTAVIVALSARYWNAGFAFGVLTALCAWFIYVGMLGYLGVIANTAMFPPGIAPIFPLYRSSRIIRRSTRGIGFSALGSHRHASFSRRRRTVHPSALD
jgi:hypothetical protein